MHSTSIFCKICIILSFVYFATRLLLVYMFTFLTSIIYAVVNLFDYAPSFIIRMIFDGDVLLHY